jgi:hypothetical protein
VYQDALAAPWIDSSWSATIDYNNASPVFSGTRSIKVAENAWGALSIHRGNWGATQPITPSLYRSFDFQVFSGSGGFSLSVRLENDAGFVFPEVVVGTIPLNQWVTVSVPMTQLDPAGQPFDRVDIADHNGTTRTYFVDAVRFVGK